MAMEWNRLLNPGRLCRSDYPEAPGREAYLQDYDRILFSEPFRRLAQKTQVHPLYSHDHVHHRMIHSMETCSVGRSLGTSVGHALLKDRRISADQVLRIAGHVQAACLLHDIGNPPFGHSGEDSIGGWFAAQFRSGNGLAARIPADQQAEFAYFEGNAQGLRIAGRLEMARREGGMRLSYATLGAFLKYPCTRLVRDAVCGDGPAPYSGLKKFGVFASDAALLDEICDATGMLQEGAGWYRRHPLAFLVEAADDICYRIMDIEDAGAVGDLDRSDVAAVLEDITGKRNREEDAAMPLNDRVALLRALSIGAATSAAVQAFMDNYDAIMSGEFDGDLIGASAKADAFAELQRLSVERIFAARRKTELEVAGRQVLHRLLDHFHGLYADLASCEWDQSQLGKKHPHWKQLIRAVDLDLRGVEDPYTAMHSLADFVSGMTDRYAVKVRGMVTGSLQV
ncbi:dGTP triphosphohydrolase [Leisingera aquimarina]|uniref:dGTP triphosphohydrolase n=1 Tax=Leisingera aquimarina TaxID=476529 RepID=UPI0004295196|nr:dNTP triphosphohydrolase [Leisingera aquimarina]